MIPYVFFPYHNNNNKYNWSFNYNESLTLEKKITDYEKKHYDKQKESKLACEKEKFTLFIFNIYKPDNCGWVGRLYTNIHNIIKKESPGTYYCTEGNHMFIFIVTKP